MQEGELHWTSGVAEQFAARIQAVFDARLGACSDKLNADLSRGSDEATVVHAMNDTRRSLALLWRVANLPPFPEMLQDHLKKLVRQFAQNAQQSLEQSADADRQGFLLRTVRHHSLLRFEESSPSQERARVSDGAMGVVGRRRNILT
jgi:hypothetical protein